MYQTDLPDWLRLSVCYLRVVCEVFSDANLFDNPLWSPRLDVLSLNLEFANCELTLCKSFESVQSFVLIVVKVVHLKRMLGRWQLFEDLKVVEVFEAS